MTVVTNILAGAGLVCFLIGTVQAQPPSTRPINWMSAGLALFAIVFLLLRA